jgi:hypothetical protein
MRMTTRWPKASSTLQDRADRRPCLALTRAARTRRRRVHRLVYHRAAALCGRLRRSGPIRSPTVTSPGSSAAGSGRPHTGWDSSAGGRPLRRVGSRSTAGTPTRRTLKPRLRETQVSSACRRLALGRPARRRVQAPGRASRASLTLAQPAPTITTNTPGPPGLAKRARKPRQEQRTHGRRVRDRRNRTANPPPPARHQRRDPKHSPRAGSCTIRARIRPGADWRGIRVHPGPSPGNSAHLVGQILVRTVPNDVQSAASTLTAPRGSSPPDPKCLTPVQRHVVRERDLAIVAANDPFAPEATRSRREPRLSCGAQRSLRPSGPSRWSCGRPDPRIQSGPRREQSPGPPPAQPTTPPERRGPTRQSARPP